MLNNLFSHKLFKAALETSFIVMISYILFIGVGLGLWLWFEDRLPVDGFYTVWSVIFFFLFAPFFFSTFVFKSKVTFKEGLLLLPLFWLIFTVLFITSYTIEDILNTSMLILLLFVFPAFFYFAFSAKFLKKI